MYIFVDKMTFYCILCILVSIYAIGIMLYRAFLYYIKRKYDSIDRYCELASNKSDTYVDIKKAYEKDIEKLGIKSRKSIRDAIKFIKNFKWKTKNTLII